MNLDDYQSFAEIDPQDMLAEIDNLPAQLWQAWELGCEQEMPDWAAPSRVLIAGMGGSAIGADLLASFAEPYSPVPITVQREYHLPAWARGEETLVIASSHSGNTEETLYAFESAQENGCRILAVTTGGQLEEKAVEAGVPVWKFEHHGQPRAAVGFSFGLLLAALSRLGLLADTAEELANSVQAMRAQQEKIRAPIPAAQNPAKRLAGQLIGRWVVVLGSEILAPVARRWKGQVSEIAKSWAQFEFLPEANHNTLAGLQHPEDLLMRSMTIFLQAPSYHPRNLLRSELTRKAFMLEGLNTDFFEAPGDSRLAQIWTALHFGDYTAYYLAMAYGVDPTPVMALEDFKQEMKDAS